MQTVVKKEAHSPPMPAERRAEPRMPCHVAIQVEINGRVYPAVASDVSVSGVFVECPRFRGEGQRVHLRFPVVGLPPTIGAEVRWVLRDPGGGILGAGVRLDSMGARAMIAWTRYVRSLW